MDSLAAKIELLVVLLQNAPRDADFVDLRRWTQEFTSSVETIAGFILALQPFEPFATIGAADILEALDTCLAQAIVLIESDDGEKIVVPDALRSAKTRLAESNGTAEGNLLAIAFGIEEEPVGADGEFRASRVFEAYKYNNHELLQRIFPHLESLGLCPVDDVLAMVCVPAWIICAENPVLAFSVMDRWLRQLRELEPLPPARQDALQHLRDSEPFLQQSRKRVNRDILALASEQDLETKALGLAEIYKRLVEGPVRQYLWGLHCLTRNVWQPPPMLTSLREQVIARGGWYQNIAETTILTRLRNGEAHETVHWDGYRECYSIEGEAVELGRVLVAVANAESLARGSEAAIAFFSALRVVPASSAPSPSETDRLPAWRRAEAVFGTNGLRVIQSQLNARKAVILVTSLYIEDINPCFQALTLCRNLLPDIETFEVLIKDSMTPTIVVGAPALDQVIPVWSSALAKFTSVPLSTFLPANFDARRRIERESISLRSAAWIAVDDVLDALDSLPSGRWNDEEAWLFAERTAHAKARSDVAARCP